MALKKDENGNDIPGSDDGQGQGDGTPPVEKQLADLIAAQKKQTADLEVMREENERLQRLVVSMRDHPGDGNGETRRQQPPRGTGRFKDPAYRSEFEQKYSLPADAAEEIIEEATSRAVRAQEERAEAVRNGEQLRKTFYESYPDLKDHEPIVGHFSDRCAREHPDWTLKQGFAEVARLSREYIKSKLGGSSGDEPPPVLSGGSNRQDGGGAGKLPGSDDETPRNPTQDEEIRAEMAERSRTRSKAL